jgi:hypothetical protein
MFFNQTLEGPQYVDSASCICRLRQLQQEAYRCSGTLTADVVTTGKYYLPQDGTTGSNDTSLSIWGGPPADTTTAYVVSPHNNMVLVPLTSDNESGQSLQDQACTGQNDTAKSALFYEQAQNLTDGVVPRLCAVEGAVPITIQDAASWDKSGCNLGFYCEFKILKLQFKDAYSNRPK